MEKVRLGDICIKGSSNIAQKDLEDCDGSYPIYGASGLIKYVDFYKQDKPYIAVVKDGAGVGRIMRLPAKSSIIGTMQYIFPNENVDIGFLAYALEYLNLGRYFSGATIPHIYFKDYSKETLPNYTLEEEKHITGILDKISLLMDMRRQQLEKLDTLVKSQFIEMFGNPIENERGFKTCKIGELFKVRSSKRVYQSQLTNDGVPFYKVADLISQIDGRIQACKTFITQELFDDFSDKGLVPQTGDILMTTRGTIGKCYIFAENDEFYFQDGMISWFQPITDKILSEFFVALFEHEAFQPAIEASVNHTTVTYASIEKLSQIPIICPDIEIQKQFIRIEQQADKSKFAIQQSLDKLETLKKALMQKYFG